MASTAATEWAAIVAYWRTNCPVVEARRCYTAVGGPPFNRPQIPSASSITTGNRLATMSALVWISLGIVGVPRSGRKMGINASSHTERFGLIVQSVYYPTGYGLDFVLPLVDDAREVFHRQTLSSGLIVCRDSDAPFQVAMPPEAEAGWGMFNVTTPYYLREQVV